ncbi:polyprenyl synthetase family protein [Streptomyces sp. NBC_00083]|uniref:polyprenyl synthetase family protein n=1 Tax=Streptomyces sp. NBC_00083 TaxID=2975647 RepID=UPI00224D84CD|nr:polyprenyl synthetase family protein [Streptomyces sp. NBC_00083]MCX5384244.1 polyprenyl synthetase family protein [Streptomyces sp. NBC_00083]
MSIHTAPHTAPPTSSTPPAGSAPSPGSAPHPGARPTAAATLARCRDLVEPALRRAVRELHPGPRRIASHAFGWCETDGTPRAGGGGKGVRQAFVVLGAEAAGAPAGAAVPGAVAIELIHTFSLMHDDIMDGDGRRRHRDSAWKAFGTGPALLAGDALFALGVRTLAEVGGARGGEAIGQLTSMLGELVHGQADDELFESRPWSGDTAVGLGEYRAMAERKTGALLGCAAALGPVLAGAPPRVTDALGRAGRQWGLAFQAVDDVLGIWGEPGITGKPAYSDLRRAKKTLPVLGAMAQDPSLGPRLDRLLAADGALDPACLRRAADLVEKAGGRAYALREARARVAAGRDHLRAVPLAGPAVDELVALSDLFLNRQR